MSILCIINVIGYIFGELSTEHIINGAVAFTGVITIFYIAQGVVLTKYRIKILIISAAILGLVNLFVTINTNYKFIEINSPLLFSLYKKANYQYLVNTGTINTAEIFGEWAMLNAFLLLPFVFMIQGNDYFRINEKFLITLGFLSSYLCAFLSFSKSVIILSLAGFFYFLYIQQLRVINR